MYTDICNFFVCIGVIKGVTLIPSSDSWWVKKGWGSVDDFSLVDMMSVV